MVLGSDCSREEWQARVDVAIADSLRNPHVLQEFKKPRRVMHPLYVSTDRTVPHEIEAKAGRLRLCPYYFVTGGKAVLSGALATFCPPDKKIIHGMQDAALLPTRVGVAAPQVVAVAGAV